jgi:hypothetical protein
MDTLVTDGLLGGNALVLIALHPGSLSFLNSHVVGFGDARPRSESRAREPTGHLRSALVFRHQGSEPFQVLHGLIQRRAGGKGGRGYRPGHRRVDGAQLVRYKMVFREVSPTGGERVGRVYRGVKNRPGNRSIRLGQLVEKLDNLSRGQLWQRCHDTLMADAGMFPEVKNLVLEDLADCLPRCLIQKSAAMNFENHLKRNPLCENGRNSLTSNSSTEIPFELACRLGQPAPPHRGLSHSL